MGCLFLSIGLSTTQGTRGPGEVLQGVMLTQAALTLQPKYYGSFYKAKNPREFSTIKKQMASDKSKCPQHRCAGIIV